MAASRKSTHYVQFPLFALAFGRDPEHRWRVIVHLWARWEGPKIWATRSPETKDRCLQRWKSSNREGIRQLARGQLRDLGYLYACELVGIDPDLTENMVTEIDDLTSFLNYGERLNGASPSVRVRVDLVKEILNGGGGLGYDTMAVFCAIISVVGSKSHAVRIVQETLRFRSLGYKRGAIMQEHLHLRADAARPLSDWKLRAAVERLADRKLLAVVTVSKRFKYFSTRHSPTELRELVKAMKIKAALRRFERKQADHQLTQQIANTVATVRGKPVPHPGLPGSGIVDDMMTRIDEVMSD